jgi:hypothetical protein
MRRHHRGRAAGGRAAVSLPQSEARSAASSWACARQFGQQLALERAVGQGLPQRPGLRQHARAALGVARSQSSAACSMQLARQRHGLRRPPLEGSAPSSRT